MSGSLKKILWMILMVELAAGHAAALGKLYLHGHGRAVIILLCGSVLMAGIEYALYRAFVKRCAENIGRVEDAHVRSVFNEAVLESGNAVEKVRIYENSEISGPFVMGILRPAVIFPSACREHLNLKLLLLHECFHIKRRDTLYKYCMLAANCFLWFHPLAYMLRYVSCQDIEISCDEAVVAGKTQEERLSYGRFLIDSARPAEGKKNVFNAYWNNGKRILRHRIDAVVDQTRRWDVFAKGAIVFMGLEAIVLGCILAVSLKADYERVTAPANEYEGVCAPPLYTEEAIASMLALEPVGQDAYGPALFTQYEERYPERSFDEIGAVAQSPWQIRACRPGRFGEAADISIQRLYFYLEDQTAYRSELYERAPYAVTYELLYRTLLAGDLENSVWGYIWKVYCPDTAASESLRSGYAQAGEEGQYLYFATAVQIKMVEPYLFETVGYADLYKVVQAYGQAYPTSSWAHIPQPASARMGTLPGEEPDAQKALAEAFAEEKGLWDVRISFPENEEEGYLLAVADKAMTQVYCVLYRTQDGGKSWQQVEMDSVGAEHTLVYEFAFLDSRQGYMALHSFSENPPRMLRTQDGGATWEPVVFSEQIPDFCQAFTPVFDGENYVVYVGKEDSGKRRGEKACYESADGGKNWEYTGQVLFD